MTRPLTERSPQQVTGSAVMDATGRYRYALRRRWGMNGGCVCWIMLNPSTADAETDDPTIRRCIGFSKTWGYAQIVVVNLFAVRATTPRELRLRPDFYQSEHEALIGSDNDVAIQRACDEAHLIVAAWGNHGALYGRDGEVRELVGHYGLHHLGLTKMRQPRHPLYAPSTVRPTEWVSGTVGTERYPDGETVRP